MSATQEDFIVNPRTNRKIKIGSAQYHKLTERGELPPIQPIASPVEIEKSESEHGQVCVETFQKPNLESTGNRDVVLTFGDFSITIKKK